MDHKRGQGETEDALTANLGERMGAGHGEGCLVFSQKYGYVADQNRMRKMQTPILILAFNRPKYLRQVLLSLKQQSGISLDDYSVHLFQDGFYNEKSSKSYSTQDLQEENISIMRELFPNAFVNVSATNLGVALNFNRAEIFAFDDLKAQSAIFLEDDLELGPFYLKTLSALSGIACKRSDIGHFAAYGDVKTTLEMQEQRPSDVIPLGHNWAFGLTRAQWLKSRPFVDQYIEIIKDIDYRDRPTNKIVDLFHGWGCGAPGTSQDVAKTLACYLTGSAKVNTRVPFGRYIGEHGLHTNPKFFAEQGFGHTIVSQKDIFSRDNISEAEFIHLMQVMKAYSEIDISKPPK